MTQPPPDQPDSGRGPDDPWARPNAPRPDASGTPPQGGPAQSPPAPGAYPPPGAYPGGPAQPGYPPAGGYPPQLGYPQQPGGYGQPGYWPQNQGPGGPGGPAPTHGDRSSAGVWAGVLALVLAIAGATLACIDATALAGWIVAGVGVALGLALLFWPKVPRALSVAATGIAAAGLVAGLILHFTVYDDADGDGDGDSARTESSSSFGSITEPSGSSRPSLPGQPSSAPSSSAAAPSSGPGRRSASSSGDGSRGAPFAFGSAERMGDWEVTVFKPYEGWDEIRAASPYESPPDSGIEYWLFPVEATNLGTESASAWWALTAGFEDSAGMLHGGYCAGTLPEDLYYYSEVAPGKTVSGNLCVEKPAGASGLWTLNIDFVEDFYFE